MRQVGILAAAGLYALDHNIDRLAEDHMRAKHLAEGLAAHDGLAVEMPQTNIIFLRVRDGLGDDFFAHLKAAGVGLSGRYGEMRLVVHKDVGDAGVDAVRNAAAEFFANVRKAKIAS